MAYFSGQGRLLIAPVINGVPGVFRYVGNVPSLNFQLETETLEHKESISGQRMTDFRLIKGKSAKMAASLEDFSAENMALSLFGAKATIAGGSVTAEVLPSGFAVGDVARLQKAKVSAVTVKDSTGSPKTLVAGTNYEVFSADHGSLRFIDLTVGGPFVQPFKVDYTAASVTNLNMLTQPAPEVWLRFEGLNTADGNKPVLVELYRVLLDPLKQFDLINDELGKLELSGAVLYDASRAGDTTMGQFGRVVLV